MAWFDRLKQGLKRTRAGLAAPLGQILRGGKLEPETMEELEEALIAADVGARVATELVESLAAAGGAPLDALKQGIKA
ncbi:MAG TPA: signal recognition particle-docking protein FtsY, partial [Candidatus Acetothermia bacterium]|nr:signal recognition particle-docking protein FtsY [Candidatus Acetothermia bacterium]